jgi:uncharacterized protein (DUF4415 family)
VGRTQELGQQAQAWRVLRGGADGLLRRCSYSARSDRFDFSKAKRKSAKRLERQITIRLDADTIANFNRLADETGIPYQTLINLYLRECAASGKKLAWRR